MPIQGLILPKRSLPPLVPRPLPQPFFLTNPRAEGRAAMVGQRAFVPKLMGRGLIYGHRSVQPD